MSNLRIWLTTGALLAALAGSAGAQDVYYPRDATLKCAQMGSSYADSSFVWKAGQTAVTQTLVLGCSGGSSQTARIYQPPSADTWELTITIRDGNGVVNSCTSSATFAADQPQSFSETCAGSGRAKATFTLKRVRM